MDTGSMAVRYNMSWWHCALQILALMQTLSISQSSHVQLAQTEVHSAIGRLPTMLNVTAAAIADTALPSTALHFEYNPPFEYNAQRRSYGPEASLPQQPRQPWGSGPRVHRVHLAMPGQRRHYSVAPHGRWVSRRQRQRHHHHHPPHHSPHIYGRWSAWSPCSPDCIKRRERFCRAKRKCGHTKHIEERKCWRCHPGPWSAPSSGLAPHAVALPQQQQQQQQQQQHHSSNAAPTIVINAAAAAATSPQAATSAGSHQVLPTPWTVAPPPPPPQPVLVEEHPPVIISSNEELETHHVTGGYEDSQEAAILDSAEDEASDSDFFVIKSKPRHWHSHHDREPQKLPSFSNEFLDYSTEQADDALNELGSALPPSSDFSQRPSLRKWPSHKHSSRKRHQHHHHHHHHHRHSHGLRQHRNQRKLKGATFEEGSDGDVFQYEDFDIDIAVQNEGNQDNDMSYEDSAEYNEYRNTSTLYSAPMERATPEHLIPKHRRIYSKWSRWTKCTPKCTTRRYKKCRVREQCGREVLREIAYCYTEGSFCQQWLQAQVQKSPAYELRPVASRRRDVGDGTLSNSIVSDFIMNGKGYRGPEYAPMKLKCGIAPIRSNKRNMYNMLKIIGGKAARKGEWPWQVAIFNRFKEAFCGGTLIAPQWILTAAHCVRKVLYVRLGEHNLDYEDGTELHLKVLKSFKHPNFDKKTVDSDVALLKLPKPVNTTTWIGFSCLPRPYQPLPKNMDCTVIGWGKRRNRDAAGTSVLHQAEVPIIPMDNCRSVYYDYTITKNMFCAGHKRGRIDTCAGDSGGPLLCRDTTKPNHPWTIFGITSFGDGCAKRNKFGIYAKVPNYVDWVWSVINCNGNCKMHQRS